MFYLLVMFVYFFQVELLVALIWTVYYVIEAGVKHLLPSHLFHKVSIK